jgi:hypothetical protein
MVPGVTPDASKPVAWRQASGFGYGGILPQTQAATGSVFDMLMQFSAASRMFEFFGDSTQVTYNPSESARLVDENGNFVLDEDGNIVWAGDVGKTLTAILEAPVTTRETIENEEEDEKLQRTIVLSRDPDLDATYGYLTDVELGGTVVIDNTEVWGIERIESRSPTFLRVVCELWYIRERDRVERR